MIINSTVNCVCTTVSDSTVMYIAYKWHILNACVPGAYTKKVKSSDEPKMH